MLKVTGSIMTGSLALLPVTIAAVPEGEKKEVTPALALEELSLYTVSQRRAPPQQPEQEAGQLEEGVASLRRLAAPYTSWCHETYSQVEPKVQRLVQFGEASVEYFKNAPKDVYPRAAIIAFTGVIGLFLARGSRVKKLLYPTGFVSLSASLYYPEQAVRIATSTGESLYEGAVQSYATAEKLWKPVSKPKKGTEPEP